MSFLNIDNAMYHFASREMARRRRLQFEGAVYHVINRGNYRRDLFETVDTAKVFERVLFVIAAGFYQAAV